MSAEGINNGEKGTHMLYPSALLPSGSRTQKARLGLLNYASFTPIPNIHLEILARRSGWEISITHYEQREACGYTGVPEFRQTEVLAHCRSLEALDKELATLANDALRMGSGAQIYRYSRRLRRALDQVMFFFHLNAAELFHFSQSARPDPADRPQFLTANSQEAVWEKLKDPCPSPLSTYVDGESASRILSGFADDLYAFFVCLDEFQAYHDDEEVNYALRCYEKDLKYWASFLQYNEDPDDSDPAVRRLLHDLTADLGDHAQSLAACLQFFITSGGYFYVPSNLWHYSHLAGVPAIRFAQTHAAQNMLSISTIATFLSAVTATTLQFSYPSTKTISNNVVNGCWFTSLVFSIGAAINGVLGMTWRQAIYCSPGSVPLWFLIWIRHSPLIFLMISVACFSTGLVFFTYSSSQHIAVRIVTTTTTGFAGVGLVMVASWFVLERWMFKRHKGHKLLLEELNDMWRKFTRLIGLRWTSRFLLSRLEAFGLVASDRFWIIMADMSRLLSLRRNDGILPAISQPQSTPGRQSNFGFAAALRGTVRLASAFLNPSNHPHQTPSRQRSTDSADTAIIRPGQQWIQSSTESPSGPMCLRRISPFDGMIRELKFSHNGKLLTVSSRRKAVVLQAGELNRRTPYQELPSSESIRQADWSGDLVLTRGKRSVRIWSAGDGQWSSRKFERFRQVEFVTPFPEGYAFLSVEGGDVTRLDINGSVQAIYHIDGIQMQRVVVVGDRPLFIGIGELGETRDGRQPMKCKPGSEIIVYDMEKGRIETQVLVDNVLRNPCVFSRRYSALGGSPYAFRTINGYSAPEEVLALSTVSLPELIRPFLGGCLHLWNIEGRPVQHAVASGLSGHVTCVDWSPISDSMFATATNDGNVTIWDWSIVAEEPAGFSPEEMENSPYILAEESESKATVTALCGKEKLSEGAMRTLLQRSSVVPILGPRRSKWGDMTRSIEVGLQRHREEMGLVNIRHWRQRTVVGRQFTKDTIIDFCSKLSNTHWKKASKILRRNNIDSRGLDGSWGPMLSTTDAGDGESKRDPRLKSPNKEGA
ncbi:hypothetical protein JAAARDRAFT_78863 [Jaapia argillacea MUCL 33604]|uniref:Uncharacterized protein n=1 Tax=Jaapia argillacea MUCL 33604 TaxID=933084 RepID=A0A067PQ69_9AGAM|nr:hypothetical protein JAAARDRAFT_78863 [Jaapia argillacea MUCL 33604]